MDKENFERSPACEAATHSLVKDLMIVLFAIGAMVLGNCGVVRALDVALDAIHR